MVLTDDVNVELLLSHFECFLSEIVSKVDRTRSRAGKRRWRRRSRGRWRDGAQAMRAKAMGGSLNLLGSGGGGKSERREEDEG